MGLAVINAPFIAGTALLLFLAASFALDGLGHATAAWRATARRERLIASVAAVGDLSVAALFLATRHMSATWLVAVAAALRMCGVAWTIAVTPVHVGR